MCRLLATVSHHPATVAEVLGADRPAVFLDMARIHDDGWGHAWTTPAGDIALTRVAESGYYDSGLVGALTAHAASAHIVHLRLATDGLSCALKNTHPFLADGIAFAHNGSLMPIEHMTELIHPEIAATIVGDTDSERYFAVIRSRIAEGMQLSEAVLAAAQSLRERYPGRSLNALLLTPVALVAVHASEHAPSPLERFARIGRGALPRDHDERYYEMHLRRHVSGRIAIASTGMDVRDWEALPHESVTTVSLSDLSIETRLIG